MNRPIGKWQWDDVRFFLAAAREGSLSGAARVLGVGHVTVGRRLAFLEKRLGVKLLNRTLACFLGDQSELVRVWPSEPPLLRPVWLLVHQDLRGSTRVRLVSAAIVDAFGRNAKILRDGKR